MLKSRRAALTTTLLSILTFGAGLAFAGVTPLGRINGVFIFSDASEPDIGLGGVEIIDTEFVAAGSVFGTGTDGDEVEIAFGTVTPTQANADTKQGRVRQDSFGRLVFRIESATPERDLDLEILPEKCAIDSKANVVKEEGQVSVDCSGTNIYGEISASQEASLQAAFQGSKKVKIKVSGDGAKGSLRIRLKGPFLPPA
jgi:hypothetical protein